MTPKEQHKIFWGLYPPRYSEEKKPLKERKKTKVGMYPCQLWFEAKKPDRETFSKMCKWVKTFRQNYEYCLRKNEFHRAPKDPLRFLKDRGWMDEIEPMTGVAKKVNVCSTCGKPASGFNKGKWHCPDHNPYGRVKFIKPDLHHNVKDDLFTPEERVREEPGDTTNGVSVVPTCDKAGAGSLPASNTRICEMCRKGRAKHQTTVDFITMNVCDKCLQTKGQPAPISLTAGATPGEGAGTNPSPFSGKQEYKARIEQATKEFFNRSKPLIKE